MSKYEYVMRVKNGGLWCAKQSDNPVLQIFDSGKETEIEQNLSKYEELEKMINSI